jgi:signal transduction histidine kinase
MMVISTNSAESQQILHVDDDPDHLEILRLSLETIAPRIEVISTDSSIEAIKMIEEQEFQCIVSDYMMPELDGIDLCRKVKKTSNIPIIIYTGQGSEEVASAAFEAGADDYIRKEKGQGHFKVLAKRIETAIQKHVFDIDRERYEERLETIYRHASELGRTNNLEEIARATLDGIEKTFGFEKMSFSIVDDNILRPIEIRGNTPLVRTKIPIDGPGLVAKAGRTRETINIRDVREDPDYFVARNNTRSELVVPAIIEGELIAVLNIESIELDAFSSEDQRLIEIFAEHIASNMVRSRANTTMDLVTAMVGHDLRGPLVTIANAVQLIQRGSERSEKLLKMIEDNASRSIMMLEDLRQLLRSATTVREKTDLSALINNVVEDAFIPDSVNMKLRLDEKIGYVMIDRSKMRRVLDNLIQNALDAMPNRGDLTISTHRDSEWKRIEISDTGKGIPEEDRATLFTPFNSRKVGGLGLGLVFSKEIVEAHGGTLSLKSEVGEGTSVTITLPIDEL